MEKLLRQYIEEVKKEFPDMNLDYLNFAADRFVTQNEAEFNRLLEADRIIRALAKAESVDVTWVLAAQNYVANNPEK